MHRANLKSLRDKASSHQAGLETGFAADVGVGRIPSYCPVGHLVILLDSFGVMVLGKRWPQDMVHLLFASSFGGGAGDHLPAEASTLALCMRRSSHRSTPCPWASTRSRRLVIVLSPSSGTGTEILRSRNMSRFTSDHWVAVQQSFGTENLLTQEPRSNLA